MSDIMGLPLQLGMTQSNLLNWTLEVSSFYLFLIVIVLLLYFFFFSFHRLSIQLQSNLI